MRHMTEYTLSKTGVYSDVISKFSKRCALRKYSIVKTRIPEHMFRVKPDFFLSHILGVSCTISLKMF